MNSATSDNIPRNIEVINEAHSSVHAPNYCEGYRLLCVFVCNEMNTISYLTLGGLSQEPKYSQHLWFLRDIRYSWPSQTLQVTMLTSIFIKEYFVLQYCRCFDISILYYGYWKYILLWFFAAGQSQNYMGQPPFMNRPPPPNMQQGSQNTGQSMSNAGPLPPPPRPPNMNSKSLPPQCRPWTFIVSKCNAYPWTWCQR